MVKVVGSVAKAAEGEAEEQGAAVAVHYPLKIPESDAVLAQVEVSLGATIPTEPYANVRVSASLRVPCHVEDLEAAYAFAAGWVDGKVSEMAEAAKP